MRAPFPTALMATLLMLAVCAGSPVVASPETQVAALSSKRVKSSHLAKPPHHPAGRAVPAARPRPDPAHPCGAVTFRQTGRAHFYGARHDGRHTANGDRFDMDDMTAAHRSLPFGTRVKVTNVSNGRSVVVRINDRHAPGRTKVIDLSRGAAEKLGFRRKGVTTVRIAAVCGR